MFLFKSCNLLTAGFLVIGLVFGACVTTPSAEPLRTEYVRADMQPGRSTPVLSESQIDTQNRYLSTVRVDTAFPVPTQGTRLKTCSGVVIAARVILTAGHCVCAERTSPTQDNNHTTFIDRSSCARNATVTVTLYLPMHQAARTNLSEDPSEPMVTENSRTGTILVHEDVRIIYEVAENHVRDTKYSHADLALIVLKEPLPPQQVEPVKLSEQAVRLREKLLLVGYGAGSLTGGLIGRHRRFGENEVASIKDDGSTFHVGTQLEIEPFYRGDKPEVQRGRGAYAAAGDSGGPCLRERQGTLELVGIARSTSGPPVVLSVYTSTYKYLAWIRERLKAVKSGEFNSLE